MLKTPDLNPHATLLTLYMNAVDQMARAETHQAVADEYTRAETYVFKNGRSPAAFSSPYSKERILLGSSLTLFRDGDEYFNRQVLRPFLSFLPSFLLASSQFIACSQVLPHKSNTAMLNTKR